MPYLVVRGESGAVTHKAELKGEVVMGRSLDCDIWVKDTRVSRKHCKIEPRGDGDWALVDLGSHNGTTVNDQAVRERILKDGDVIKLGKDRIKFYKGTLRNNRAADPLMAGLEDVEENQDSAAGFPVDAATAAGETLSGSSLFASRVIASTPTADDSILSPVVPSGPVAPGPAKSSPPRVVTTTTPPPRHNNHAMLWGIAVGVALTLFVVVVMWMVVPH